MQIRQNRAILAAPLAVLLLVSGCFAAAGLFPFGSKTVAWCDMNHQVVPLMMEFQDILAGKTSMFLNLQNAGGMDFWGVFFFFLSSPFTFLTAFVPKADFYVFMNILLLLKLALCAGTAAVLFTTLFPHLNTMQASSFSVMYACSGFAMMYYQNIVWLDMAALFPILVLGVYRLCRAERPALFVLTLCAVIVVNYYLSAMVFFWLVLLFGVLSAVYLLPRRRGRVLMLLGLSTAAALLATAVVWLPSFLEYLQSGRVMDLVSSVSGGSFTPSLPTTLPIWTCTAAAVAAVPLYLTEPRKREVQGALFLTLLFLLLPLVIDPIDRMWHLGSYQAFPVRFGYMIPLTGLLLTAWHLEQSQRLAPPQPAAGPGLLLLACAGTAGAAALGAWLLRTQKTALTRYAQTLWADNSALKLGLLFTGAVLCVYLLLFFGFRCRRFSVRAVSVLLCVVTAVELCFNVNVYVTAAAGNGNAYQSVTDLQNRVQDSSLYRMKVDDLYFDTNLTGALGYPALDHYTSLTNGVYMESLQKLGYSSHWMEIHSSGGTLLTDALLAQKYSITRSGSENGRKSIYSNGTYSIVKQPYSLPFGFVTQALGSTPKDGDRFAAQNTLYQTVFGKSDSLLTRVSPTELYQAEVETVPGSGTRVSASSDGSVLYQILVTGKTTLYFDCYNKTSRDLSSPLDNAFRIYVNNKMVMDNYPNGNFNGLLDLGTFEDQKVEIQVEVLHNVDCLSFGVAKMDDEKLEAALQQTQTADLQADGSTISGTVQAKSGGWLVLPLRGGSGFHATVNGTTAQTSLASGTFLAVKLQAGKNTVRVQYTSPGFVGGAVCSVFGAAAVILLLLLHRKKWLRRLRWLEKPAGLLFAGIAALMTMALYIFPVVLYLAQHIREML
ncbi:MULTISPECIES: YfhO family protein [Caproicibacterium]|uniref:YfhO family protein n=1 Tax=Caproicibacterium argilliputei TaxID=3030016 RepID=A0AA97D715_9FIRM|nr:YfhO family protein [Caproicibacterium argilliputei]WOC31436.1 YfhO family protein [Caproicibacterium argilliputei]